jgi:hypothetical protein
MKTTKLTLMAIMAVTTLVACSSDEERNDMYIPDEGEIVLQMVHPGTVSLNQKSMTRATETAFEANDSIGVYVTAADAALQLGGNEVNNELFVYNGTLWNSKRKVYWNEGLHNVYAYYPYSKQVNDVQDYSFSVQENQNSVWGYTHSDFLWAGATNVEASASPVTMQFAHKMSSVVVLLEKGENFEGSIPANAEVFLYSTVTKATIDLATGDVARDSYAGTGTICCRKMSNTEYWAIVVPQNIASRRPLVEVVIGDVSYLMEGKISYKPGMRHTITVTLDKNPEQTKIDIGGEIVGW